MFPAHCGPSNVGTVFADRYQDAPNIHWHTNGVFVIMAFAYVSSVFELFPTADPSPQGVFFQLLANMECVDVRMHDLSATNEFR